LPITGQNTLDCLAIGVPFTLIRLHNGSGVPANRCDIISAMHICQYVSISIAGNTFHNEVNGAAPRYRVVT